jgi:2-polyprenyl-3-methyl-5-hydroxy-6-metoxy-1,4-benzoquinol methylase
MDQQAAEIFISNWRVYQKVISSDYMFHRKFGSLVGDHIKSIQTRLRILDMGCGDASLISHLLDPSTVLFYKGLDLSAPALDLAADNLKATGVPYELANGPMEELIQTEDGKYDLVYSSYAIHHLQDQQKSELLHMIADKLEDGGRFIWTDVFRAKGQSRVQYLENYMKMITEEWTDLTPDEKKLIDDHIHNFDFPAEYPDALAWLGKFGLKVSAEESGDRFHKTLVSIK